MKNISLQVKLVSMLILFCSFLLNQTTDAAGKIGLSKKAEITTITASGANRIQVTYHVENSGSETLSQIELTDDYKTAFAQMGTMSNVTITVTSASPASDVNLPVNLPGYPTSNLLILNGMMKSGTSAIVTLTFDVKLTDKFKDDTEIQGVANIYSWDDSGDEVKDNSNDGDTPITGLSTPTRVPLTQIVIEAVGATGMNKTSTPPSTTVSETDGTMTYIIKRKGYLSQTSKVDLDIRQLAGATAATLGTLAGTNVDAWRNPLIETLTFNYGESQKTLTINLVNDDMYEDNEFFDIWLQTPTAQYTNKDYNNVSILIPQVKVTITSDDPKPAATISTTSNLQITEGTGGGSTPFLADITLSGTSSQTITVPWSITVGAANLNAPTSGSATFTSGEKKKTITININKDNIREADAQVRIQLGTPTNAGLGIPSYLDFKILDDDLRQIQWLNNTPKSLSGRMDAGSGINDTIDIHFLVIQAPLDNPKIQVKLPANVTYVNFINLIDDASTAKVKYSSNASGVVTFVLDGATSLQQNQKVHFRVVRRAECAAATGAKSDEVKVIADGDANGVEEMTTPDKIGTGARVKYANYNIYLGNLSMLWKEGENLVFDKTEMGSAKMQALTISNNGQGKINTFDFNVKFTSGIGTLQNAKIRGTTRNLTFTGPTTASGFDSYKITLTTADIAFIGNKNNFFENGEEMIIEYEFKSTSSAKCGIKSETVWVDWSCKKPAASLNTTISLYEPQGKPELVRTLKTPTPIKEDGTPNNFILELKNTGKADAYNVKIPLTVSGETESFALADIKITIDGVDVTSTANKTGNTTSMNITGLIIPSGKTAIITFPVKRTPMNRYNGKTNWLDGGYFSRVYCGDITYTDECEDPNKKGTIGYTYFNAYKPDGTGVGTNVSYMPELMTTDIARIDISTDPTANKRNIAFELGTVNTIFPMYDALDWFGNTGSYVEVTLTLTNNIALAGVSLKGSDNSAGTASFTNVGNTYTINIPYAGNAKSFQKNGKLEMILEGSCSGGSTINPVNYTIDFITNQSVRHKLYKKSFNVLVKCDIDPGANLKGFTAKRVNYIKGDANNNGIYDNAADATINTGTMRLDRIYHNDTIEFQYIVKIGQHNAGYDAACLPATVEPWNMLYATAGNINSTNLKHYSTSYSIYDQNKVLVVNQQPTTPQNAGAGKDYILIDRTGMGHKFEHKDSVVITSLWVAKTTNGGQWERSDQLSFWTYCEMTARTPANIFTDRPITNLTCDPLEQNYEKEFANISFYSVSTATNGARQYKNTFTNLYTPQDAKYDHHLSIGYRGYNNGNFPNELRQPYYIDNMEFELPYGYRITGGIQFFGYASRTDMAYARYPKYTGISTPQMQGIPHNVPLTNLWDINIWNPVNNPATKGQLPDEGWIVQPYIPVDVTPKANPGESIVTFRLNYKSPTLLDPFVLGSASNTDINEPGFILYNNAASFVLSCGAPETVAYTDTVRWSIRITNYSSAKDVKNGWIYIDGKDMELVKIIDKSTNTEVVGKQGFEGKWVKVTDLFPKETFKDYYLVARYTQYHCDSDTMRIWPWHDYKETNETPLTLFTSAALDTADLHVGRSVELYVVNQQSEISGEITPLEDTPKNPANPTSGLFGKSEIVLGNSFPVEIKLSSNDIIAVKDVGLTLNIPEGLKYIADSAYYQWKGANLKVALAAETKLRTITGATATSVNLTLDEITGIAASQLAGTYKTLPQDRELYLRFRLLPECTGFNADSIVLSAQINGNRLCGQPATGDNDTIVGRQIYLQGHRYYLMRDEIFTPNGNVFALCDDARASRTIQVSFTRIGGGELQDDKFELKIPDHFDLDGVDPVKYIDPSIDPALNPILLSNTTNAGIRTIKWDLPREYSKLYTSNITVEYSVDLKLDVTAPNLPDKDTIVANIVVDHVQCPGDANLLATDTLNLYIYNAKIGLAKDVAKSTPTADGYVPVTYTYTITNYSNTDLVGVQLSDDLIGMFGNLVELKNQFTITSSSTDLVVDPTYVGMGNIVQSGEIAGGATETVTLQIWAKPTFDYDGRVFENNAYIRSANIVGCEANDTSTVGLNPASPDLDPYLNDVPTPVWFNIIRFKHNPPEFRIPESIGDLVLTVERVGQDFSPAEVDIKLENESVQLPGTEAAKLGTSNTYPIDAWWNESSLSKTLGFAQDEKEKQITIHIVDDKIYETLETFLAILVNQRYLSSTDVLSLMNDTIHVTIEDNDKRPTLNITAVSDSILEGTIPPAPYGCTNMGFQLKLTNPTYQEVKVDWQTTTGGTGVPGTDFRPQTQITATIAPEDTVLIVNVCVIADDIPEPSKTVEVQTITGTFINALAPTNAANRRAMATIIDDDLVITLVKLKHLTCKGDASGEIIIKVAGGETGTGDYTYSWTGPGGFTASNDTITNLQAGVYAVTVKDKWGTTVSASYTVEEPAVKLAIAVDNVQNATCYGDNDGLINTTISGGWDSPNYTIGWTKQNSTYTANTDDINTLTAGVYVLTVSDSAKCVVIDSIAITEPLPISIADTVIHDVTCKGANDGSIKITPSGGNAPYFINWKKGASTFANNVETISGLSPDTYTVTISDSKLCPSATDTFVIREPATQLSAYVDTLVNVACMGDASGKVVIKAEGGWGKYTYEWSDGVITDSNTRSDLLAMDYSVIVTDSAGCSRVLSPISIIEPTTRMEVTLTATDETYQNGNDGTITVNVINGVPAYTYSWDDAPALDTDYRKFLEAGTYTVTVTDQWNCVMSATAVINEPKTVDNLPNVFTPDGDGFNDKLLEGFHIKVFDRWGLLLYEGTEGWDGRYKGKMMSAGTYFYVLIDDATGKVYKSSVLLQSFK